MQKFIKLTSGERKNIIQKTANDLGLRFDIIEKDIWVCYVLQKLFSNEKLKNNLVFKGGTCLSKAYNAIDRFSEDVDITINANLLDIKENTGTSSGNQKYAKRNKKAARKFVENEIVPILKEVFDDELAGDDCGLVFDESDNDNVTLLFYFPVEVNSFPLRFPFELTDNYSYIKPRIKLEFGALGGIWPSERKIIQPYAKKVMADYFDEFAVNTLSIKRNFIEKLLILHSIVLCPENKPINQNYSRHYYDVYSIIKSGLNINPVADLEILESVVDNESKFWTKKWINYDNLKKFSDIKLIPDETRITEIKKDYKNMEEMFFKEFPKFEEIVLLLKNFEDTLIAKE